jgi:hypothetical protein
MIHTRKILVVLVCLSAVLWFVGPAGRLMVILPLLLFGPGYIMEQQFGSNTHTFLFVRPALWLGLSISSVVLLYTWATALGQTLSPTVLGVLAALCGLGVGWQMWRASNTASSMPQHTLGRARKVVMIGALAAILGITLVTRVVQVEDLVVPAWVDPVHHALLIRVAAEQGQAPYSLRPYLPVDNLPYHWGYHVFVAPIWQLSGLELPDAMLWSGQIFNTLHVLTCAALATYFWRQPLAGVVAGLVVGLVSNMPAYYVSWGRYTQLTGLLMLPPLVISWHAWLHRPTRWNGLCTAMLLAGLSVVHVRVLVFALALMAIVTMLWLIEEDWHIVRLRLVPALAMGGLAVALTGPWLWHLIIRELVPAVGNPQTLVGGGNYNALKETLLWSGQNRLLAALAMASAFWGLWHRARVALMFVGWVVILIVLANPWLAGYLLPLVGILVALWGLQQRRVLALLLGCVLLVFNPALVQLPYVWLINNEVVTITLFVPFSVLIGGGTYMLYNWLEHLPRFRVPARVIYIVLLVVASGWGAWNLRTIINPVTVFVHADDMAALEWVRENTPSDARFLINATGWLPAVDRGVDGGWWLMPLTGRWTSTPPVLYVHGPPDYVEQVQARSKQIASFEPGQEQQLYALMRREGITHIYIRDYYTNLNGARVSPPIMPHMFQDTDRFEQLYQHNTVTIFAVTAPEPALSPQQ